MRERKLRENFLETGRVEGENPWEVLSRYLQVQYILQDCQGIRSSFLLLFPSFFFSFTSESIWGEGREEKDEEEEKKNVTSIQSEKK